MRFQRTASDAAPVGAELVPDGEHLCEITGVKEWSSKDGSREAVIVTLQPVDPRYAAIEKWLDPTNERDGGVVAQLGDLIGQDGEEIDICEETCKGLRLKVVAKNGIRKRDGVAVVYVNGLLAAPQVPVWQQNREEPAPKKPAARTPLQKAKAAHAAAGGEDGDDVPF